MIRRGVGIATGMLDRVRGSIAALRFGMPPEKSAVSRHQDLPAIRVPGHENARFGCCGRAGSPTVGKAAV